MTVENIFKEIKFNRPTFLVLSGFSGVGKTTVCQRVINGVPGAGFSVSITTRPPRENEIDGKDYIFVSQDHFSSLIKEKALLEYEEVHGNYYGTPLDKVEHALTDPGLFVFDVDVHGGLAIKNRYPEAILVFLHPPDMEELKKRLTGRKTDDEAVVRKRLERIPKELKLSDGYDYNLINDDLEKTLIEISRILTDYQK